MAKYYNRGRGNLPLTLLGGISVSVPGNSWIELTGKDQTCQSVIRALRKGFLYRQPEPAPKAPSVATAPPKAATPEKAVAPEEVSEAPPALTVDEAKTMASAKDEAEEPAPAAPELKPSTAGTSTKTKSRRRRRSSP